MVYIHTLQQVRTLLFLSFFIFILNLLIFADGFTYGSSTRNWPRIAEWAKKNSMIFIPSVGPGYIGKNSLSPFYV